MNPQNRYRLDEYQISELSDGRIWWTSHSGVAIQTGGPPYVLGYVLLIGGRRSEEKGLDTTTGKQLEAKGLKELGHPHDAICSGTMAGKPESFRLGRYQLSITTEGDIRRKSYAGMCQIVESSVLIHP